MVLSWSEIFSTLLPACLAPLAMHLPTAWNYHSCGGWLISPKHSCSFKIPLSIRYLLSLLSCGRLRWNMKIARRPLLKRRACFPFAVFLLLKHNFPCCIWVVHYDLLHRGGTDCAGKWIFMLITGVVMVALTSDFSKQRSVSTICNPPVLNFAIAEGLCTNDGAVDKRYPTGIPG